MLEKITIDGRQIAVQSDIPAGATHNLLWLPGYLSDMSGTKASFLAKFCVQEGLGLIRFDPSGVGLSERPGQEFLQATLSNWLSEALHIYKLYDDRPIILVGSSCGGWLALLAALALQKQGRGPAGLLLLAPAPDFTSRLLYDNFTTQQKQELEQKGHIYVQEEGAEAGLPFSQKFILDSQQFNLLKGLIPISCPVYIMHGQQDKIVPLGHILALLEKLAFCDASLTLIKDGDHRLARDSDLQKLMQLISDMVKEQ